MKYDVAVIGAGLAGLTAAATLAKKGKKVIVLEQHFIPGGCATVFTRKDIRFEVGLHKMDFGGPSRDLKHIIFKRLGLDKTLPLVELPNTWKISTNNGFITIPHGLDNAIKTLTELFPEEKDGIRAYFRDMKITGTAYNRLPHDMNIFHLLSFIFFGAPFHLRNKIQQANVGDKYDKYIKNEELKHILDVNSGYYTGDSYRLSWFYHAMGQYAYYTSARFIKGGSQVLSDQLVDIIKANGGEVRLMADVQKINLKENVACGVTYLDRKTKEIISIDAEKVIANCAPETIFNGNMVPSQYSEPKVEGLPNSVSLSQVYIIFKEKLEKKIEGFTYSNFFTKGTPVSKNPISQKGKIIKEIAAEERPFSLTNYSSIDSGLIPEGDPRGFGEMCSIGYLSEWESLSPEDYKAKKEQLAQRFFERVEEVYPGFKDNIDYYEVATPKTMKRYLKTPGGTAYGYDNVGYLKNKTPIKASQIKNLFYASAWSFGGGFTGTIVSGYKTAVEMLRPTVLHILGVLGISTVTVAVAAYAISKIISHLS
ncbi:MAG: phytoene desaturase family protein [Brevinema sp.]